MEDRRISGGLFLWPEALFCFRTLIAMRTRTQDKQTGFETLYILFKSQNCCKFGLGYIVTAIASDQAPKVL